MFWLSAARECGYGRCAGRTKDFCWFLPAFVELVLFLVYTVPGLHVSNPGCTVAVVRVFLLVPVLFPVVLTCAYSSHVLGLCSEVWSVGHDIIQIKFKFRHAWPTFEGVIVLCSNLVFRTFLCSLLTYRLEIWSMNLSWHNTDQVRVSSRLIYFYRSYCPLLKFSFPDFSLLSFEMLTWNLVHVYEFVMA